jgi:folate-dependent phosphoribosylglycinamide formyltransferase PurN
MGAAAMSRRLALTAGFDRAPHAILLADRLREAGHEVAAVLVVNPYSVRRLRALTRQRGRGFARGAARRLLGRDAAEDDPLAAELAGQTRHRSLRSWCRENGVPHRVVSDLNSKRAVETLREARPDGVVYAGGGILGDAFIEAARGRVLNAHSGRMPEIRGMNAAEWSLLLNVPLAVTIHLIDGGIDTGPILERIDVPVAGADTIGVVRARCALAGVDGLVRAADRVEALPEGREPGAADSLQCFVLAPALREILEASFPIE